MSGARVTEAHRAKAAELLGRIDGHPFDTRGGFAHDEVAQALADAEAGEREACAVIVETKSSYMDIPTSEAVAATIRSRGEATS